jgi:hypothetical protein
MLDPDPKTQRQPKSKIQIYPNPVEKSRKYFMKQVTTENPFRVYLTAIERELQQGIASEHTHRPALKAFIEAVTGTLATNEPKRIKCGAPGLVNAGKREKSERGGKPKEWEKKRRAGPKKPRKREETSKDRVRRSGR